MVYAKLDILHSEKSVYYDKIFNPYGVPPPGMPYKAHRGQLNGRQRMTSLTVCLLAPTAEERAALQIRRQVSKYVLNGG